MIDFLKSLVIILIIYGIAAIFVLGLWVLGVGR